MAFTVPHVPLSLEVHQQILYIISKIIIEHPSVQVHVRSPANTFLLMLFFAGFKSDDSLFFFLCDMVFPATVRLKTFAG